METVPLDTDKFNSKDLYVLIVEKININEGLDGGGGAGVWNSLISKN